MERLEQTAQKLRAKGLRVTPQRIAVWRHLQGNTSHPTAESIFAALSPQHPGLSLSTVYKALEALEQAGEVKPVRIGRQSVRFDPHTEAHHHAVCRQCGSILDIEHSALRSPVAPSLLPGQASGFSVEAHHIVFTGLCESCRHVGDGRRGPAHTGGRVRAKRSRRTSARSTAQKRKERG